jgi:carbonic anhydrase
MSVLQYGVDALKVKHIIVCGHYGCGGVRAAMTGVNFGLLNKWIRSIKDVFARNQRELEAISDNEERLDLLVEKNVREQVINLAKTSIVQKAWFQEQRPQVHGWVFDLRTGMIKELLTVSSLECLPEIYHYKTEQFG